MVTSELAPLCRHRELVCFSASYSYSASSSLRYFSTLFIGCIRMHNIYVNLTCSSTKSIRKTVSPKEPLLSGNSDPFPLIRISRKTASNQLALQSTPICRRRQSRRLRVAVGRLATAVNLRFQERMWVANSASSVKLAEFFHFKADL